jgi:hypothetical protein
VRFLVLVSVVLAGCSVVPEIDTSVESWAAHCYKDFERDISEIAGPGAVDCGFLPLEATDGQRAATERCAKGAVKSGVAFKFGYGSFGHDSAFCDIAIRRPDGQLISFFFDSDVSGQMGRNGNNSVVWTKRCSRIKFKPGTIGYGSFFDLRQCTDAPEIFSALASQNEA